MKLCINGATTMEADFEIDIKAYSAAGFKVVELWLDKVLLGSLKTTLDILLVHINDVEDLRDEILTDANRVLRREGVLKEILSRLRQICYEEYFNERIWSEDTFVVTKNVWEVCKICSV